MVWPSTEAPRLRYMLRSAQANQGRRCHARGWAGRRPALRRLWSPEEAIRGGDPRHATASCDFMNRSSSTTATPMTANVTPYDAGACCAPVCWRLFDTLPDGGLLGYGPCVNGPADCVSCDPTSGARGAP